VTRLLDLRSPQSRCDNFACMCIFLETAAVRLLASSSSQSRVSAFTRVSVPFKAPTSRPYVDPFLMAALLPIGRRALLHPQFQFQWPCNIHQRTQFNVWQLNSMTLLSISAADLRIMIGSAHSVDFLSVLNFSTAHTTHPKDRFRHPTPKTVSSFVPASCPAIRNRIHTQFSNPSGKNSQSHRIT
jgi:hypothetical protein